MKKFSFKSEIVAVAIAIISFVLVFTGWLYNPDKMLSDRIYQTPSVSNKNIKIIAIDEKTLDRYGTFSNWSRERTAELIEKLSEDPENAPSVIALDLLLVSENNDAADARLVEAARKAGNVVSAVNLVYRTKNTRVGDTLVQDINHVELVEYPFDQLKAISEYGFANTRQDTDGYIRHGQISAAYTQNGGQTEVIESLSYKIYERYCAFKGVTPQIPKTMDAQVFGFTYTGKSGAYETLSMCDVIDGKIDARVFRNTIVMVGAYAPGMQDAFNVANQRGSQMYGVEIHANILEALLEGKTQVNANKLIYAIIAAIAITALYLVQKRTKPLIATVIMIAEIGLVIGAGKLLYVNGKIIDLLPACICILATFIYHIGERYLTELIKKRKVISAFKKYVAPQVVEEVSKSGEFKIVLGGEKRDIAVLFVDIRGFTPMSEGLQPEQVVEILNEYLNLTTKSIFKNNGTLDKFVGDATMAVFNAPFDLDDYIYRAVCTARDIAAGSDELEKKLMERFGKSVSFGIGVNCGPAVVGNIGCDFRMDYTAIGDTVNTAARLEANAKRGQVLISDAVYEALKGRIEVTEVGAIPLKGKSNEVFVYQLDKVL